MTDYNPSVDTTIFPRINFLKTFGDRFAQRAANGRIFGATGGPGPGPGPSTFIGDISFTVDGAAVNADDIQAAVTGTSQTVSASISGDASPTYTWSVASGSGTISGSGDTIQYTGTADGISRLRVTARDVTATDDPQEQSIVFLSSTPTPGPDNPTTTFDFAGTLSLDSRITLTRASTATYVDSSGLIQTAAADTARFTHDPTTLESKGLLIEGAATNYIPNSLCSNANAWGINGLVVTDNAGTAPDGTTTATFVTPETGNYTITSPLRTLPTDGEWTNSVFVKPDGMTEFTLNATSYGSTGNNSVVFDTTQSGVGGAGITPDAANNANYKRASMVHYPNGWVRISLTVNIVAPDLIGNWQLKCTGDGASSFYVWHWQQEQRNVNSFPSSLIPTNGAAVTRAADNADITGTNFSDWYNQSEGTLVVKYNRPTVAAGDNRIVTLLGASESVDRMSFMIRNNFTRLKLVGETNNVVFANTTMGGTDTSANPTFAYGYSSATNGHRVTQQGITATFTSAPPANTRLVIGYSTLTSESYLGGTVAKIEYYNTRLTDAEIDALT